MSSTPLLTIDDLDAIAGGDPRSAVTELVAAVDARGLADSADAGYALTLAAELTEKQGELDAALELAERAIDAYRQGASTSDGFARALRGDLLARMGRDDEAMAAFTALRPRLVREPDAASYLSEALENVGQAEIAEQWLTTALLDVLDRPEDGPAGSRVRLAYALVQARRRLRREMGLPADEHDDLADRMTRTLAGEEPPPSAGRRPGQAVMFWPRAEFDQVLLRWPAFADVYGHTWDDHRADLEKALTVWAESGESGFRLLPGSASGLAEHMTRHGADPDDADVRADYAAQLENRSGGIAWPPGRNDPCWCGSAAKYKKCCLPRSR